MTGNGESRRKEGRGKFISSVSDYPVCETIVFYCRFSWFKNICVPEKCPARKASPRREGKSILF